MFLHRLEKGMEFHLIKWDEELILSFHEKATSDGYRLATVEEAAENVEKIREMFKGTKWDDPPENTRLLDGWMSRSKKPTNGYKQFLWDWMLVVKIVTGEKYSSIDDVYSTLFKKAGLQKHATKEMEEALLFFTRDGYTELVMWLLKSTMVDPLPLLTHDEKTILHLAVAAGKAEIVEVISQYCVAQNMRKYFIGKADAVGVTALLEAVKREQQEIVKILLASGAQPLDERDVDGRTALHYAAQLKNQKTAIRFLKLLLDDCYSAKCKALVSSDTCICRPLLLCAKARGIGTAEDSAKSRGAEKIYNFLLQKRRELPKGNLLQMAARLDSKVMIRELLNRGFLNAKTSHFLQEEMERVEQVRKQIDSISRSAADTPAADDSLGRIDFAKGLAALFLNPFIASPIVVGILGEWGTGKSSLMIQVEHNLLQMAAALAFTNLSQGEKVETNLLSPEGQKVYNSINEMAAPLFRKDLLKVEKRNKDPVLRFLAEYRDDFKNEFKSLAVMDRSQMIQSTSTQNNGLLTVETEHQPLRTPPGVLTVRYNAWRYRKESEAWAGLAVEITKAIEARMTRAQLLATRWRYSWRKKSSSIWLDLIFPLLLVLILTPWMAWLAWVLISKSNNKALESGFKYGGIPVTALVIGWTAISKIMSILKPISEQIAGYIFQSPDHSDKLGYQENVIEDIMFLKEEIGKKPSKICLLLAMCWNRLSFYKTPYTTGMRAGLQISPAANCQLRLIVFVDDLDRCPENVILEVLSAINLVLAVCEINVVLGMDKTMIERAINSKFADESCKERELEEQADKYLRKIIQLPLDLPDPSDKNLDKFLDTQLGVEEEKESSENPDEGRSNDKDESSGLIHFSANVQGLSRATSSSGNDGGSIQLPQHPDIPSSSGDQNRINISSLVIPMLSSMQLGSGRRCGNTASSHMNHPVLLNISTDPLQGKEGEISGRSHHEDENYPISITDEMLIPEYSSSERKAFRKLSRSVTYRGKNPRDWKRFLNYHRLSWNILSQRAEVTALTGWQLQLVMWIFVCWRWRDQMDILIKKWPRYMDDRVCSLGEIVQNCISYRKRKEEARLQHRRATHYNAGRTTLDELDVEKELHHVHIQTEKEKQGFSKEETEQRKIQKEKEKRRRHDDEELIRFGEILSDKYDVSKEAIRLFQVFRFHCKPRHLSIPLTEEEKKWKEMDRLIHL